ncbi:MAG TPA: hypothetical protein VHY91_06050 [Pirellulales bacterium]|jgi:hypothetical protein|nr:hypothetical protein [Pirellulales bacterium]
MGNILRINPVDFRVLGRFVTVTQCDRGIRPADSPARFKSNRAC